MRKVPFLAFVLLALLASTAAQQSPALPGVDKTQPPAVRISLEDAIRLALQHNHALQATRTTIPQSQAQETTAGLRPNPVVSGDYNFVPAFSPSFFGVPAVQAPLPQEADVSLAYTVEMWHKRRDRLTAAKDQTATTRSLVADSARQLVFNVAQQFVAALLAQSTIDFTQQNLDSFQKTVDISETRYKAGAMSEGDLLKIKLQMQQFQNDVFSAKLAKLQALASLRQFLGFESVPDSYDVAGELEYLPVHGNLDDLKALALRTRPDLQAAQLAVVGAQSQYRLAKANGKPDLTPSVGYSHAASEHTINFGLSFTLPVFDRNQGEVARTRHVITQNQELNAETSQQVLTDVVDAYAALRTSEQIVQHYQGGYIDQAIKSREISEYAYKRGAASLLDYLDTERTYRAIQLAFRQALASYMTALEQMRQAVGTRSLP